jgi:hypothetical protein
LLFNPKNKEKHIILNALYYSYSHTLYFHFLKRLKGVKLGGRIKYKDDVYFHVAMLESSNNKKKIPPPTISNIYLDLE